jgi:hypothetical protein
MTWKLTTRIAVIALCVVFVLVLTAAGAHMAFDGTDVWGRSHR